MLLSSMESVVKCIVCFSNESFLINACNTDAMDIKWSSKLRLCVPEVDWLDDYLICNKCIHQLETAYEFRELCLKSFEIRKYLNNLDRCKANDNLLNTALPVMYHCKKCLGIPFKNSYELALHNVDVHFIVDCPYICMCCDENFKSNLELMRHEITHFNLSYCKNGYNSYNVDVLELDCQRIVDSAGLRYSKVNYLEHALEEKNKKDSAYNCYTCGKLFNTKMLLVTHLNFCKLLRTNQVDTDIPKLSGNLDINNRYDKAHRCKECLSLFSTANEIEKHYDKCVGIYNQQLKVNADGFQDDIEDNENITNIQDVPTISVPIEKRLISFRPKKRGRKKLEKVDQASNLCPTCGMVFNSRYLLKRHICNVHATEKNFQCDLCEQKFTSPVYLNAHKRYHSGERPHICSFCGKSFITGSDLYHHEKIHANKRSYKCEKCSKAFNTSSDLHKHKLCVHLDRSQWKYVCTFCERRFPLKTNLDSHTKTHTGERNFACHLCDRKCINRSVLMRHVKSHSNVRLFKCNLCQLEYKYEKSLDIHMTKTHGIGDAKIPERIKKYLCSICPKSYFANNKLQKHIRTHTGERPFSCHICDKRFIDKSYVKQHLKSAHKVLCDKTYT